MLKQEWINGILRWTFDGVILRDEVFKLAELRKVDHNAAMALAEGIAAWISAEATKRMSEGEKP